MRKLLIGVIAATGLVMAQTTTAPPGEVIGVGNFIHLVSDVEKSVEFYHNVLGMDLQGAPPSGPRPYIATPEIVSLYNATGAQYRVGATLVPQSPMRAELVEWKDIDRKPVRPRYQDPGAATMIVSVRDLDAIMARVKKSGTPIVTTGGEPVTLNEGSSKVRAILLRDPDGFFVELIERDSALPTTVPADSNLLDVSFAFTVSDTDRMLRVFRDALGFQPQTGALQSDGARLKLMGTPGAQYRRTVALVPGTSFPIEFLEFKGIDRAPVHSRPQDIGSPVLRLRVHDMDSVLKALAMAGVTVASQGGEPITLKGAAATQRFAITSAPDNLFVQVIQQVVNP
jgi:catechol 2,3-dioxygenase-like lactoylglutathione lyase family enzyme